MGSGRSVETSSPIEPSLTERDVASLRRAAAYPEESAGEREEAAGAHARGIAPEFVQTHLSTVFLTRERVYKFRKAVDFGFVSFATRAERTEDCLREVELNRRLAPDVYLGVAALVESPGGLRIGPTGDRPRGSTEHCVVMRRLAEGRDALSLLLGGHLSAEAIDRFAERIAHFHSAVGLGQPAPFSEAEWCERYRRPVEDNFAILERASDLVDSATVREARDRARGFALEQRAVFEARRLAGRAVDAHGDLHLEHIWYETDDAAPLVIDCLEFSERLRHIDSASEVAFPFMDLCYREAPELAARFLSSYAAASDDYDLFRVVDYFASYRAAVRAKVAAIAAAEPEVPDAQRARAATSASAHLDLAVRLQRSAAKPRLALVGGIVGSGKSTVAAVLADAAHGVRLSSDPVRRSELGLAPGQRAPAEAYSEAGRAKIYAALLVRAEPVLASGRSVVLDATFERAHERELALAWARERGVEAEFVEVRCPREVALDRLAKREARGDDPSDAGPDRWRASHAAFEPLDRWPGGRALIHTERPDWRRDAEKIARHLVAS